MNDKLRVFAIAVVLLLSAAGCAAVAPYQRERLAHHSMLENDYAGLAEQHLRAVHEGALGGGKGAANGCGCN